MKISIDTESKILLVADNAKTKEIPLYSEESFKIISSLNNKIGWNEKYVYTFSWLGRPIIQLPDDMVRIQEVIYRIQPDVIIETGVAHGGSLIFYASLCKLNNKGKVIGVDIEVRPHNRVAIENHELSSYITLIEGSSVDSNVLNNVASQIKKDDRILVILDSNHTKQHVLTELEKYKDFVSVDSYIVATDGIMQDLYDVPRGHSSWKEDNPVSAVEEFLSNNSNFIVEQPEWPFNESKLSENITHWPMAYLKRVK